MSRRDERIPEGGEQAFGESTARQRPANNANAIAIVVAGALIAGGILASVLLRGGDASTAGNGTNVPASQEPSAVATSPGASVTVGQTPTTGPSPSIPEIQRDLHLEIPHCVTDHVRTYEPWAESPLEAEMVAIATAAAEGGQTHACTVTIDADLRVYVTYHKYQATEEMDAVFAEVFEPYRNISSAACEDVEVEAGYASYGFGDGRAGTVLCSRQRGAVVFFAWTEETTDIISLVYGTNTSDETLEAIRSFWVNGAGPICRPSEGEPPVELARCASD